jgi:hypothetical protein
MLKKIGKILGVMVVALIFSQGCTSPTGSTSSGGSGGGGGSGTGWTVTVSPSQSSLPQSVSGLYPTLSTTTIIIRVVDSSGNPPASGQIIYFTCSNGAFGFQDPGTYQKPITSTNALLTQGQAFVTFTAGFSGPTTAVINATYLGATGSATISITANPTPTPTS